MIVFKKFISQLNEGQEVYTKLGTCCSDCVQAISYDDYSGMDDDIEEHVRAAIENAPGYLIVGDKCDSDSYRKCCICDANIDNQYEVGYFKKSMNEAVNVYIKGSSVPDLKEYLATTQGAEPISDKDNAEKLIKEIKFVLNSILTQYDMKQIKTRFYNPNALYHYLQAVDRVEELLNRGLSLRKALCECFNDRLLNAVINGFGMPKATNNEIKGWG